MDIDVTKLDTAPETEVKRLFVTVYSTAAVAEPPFQGFAQSVSGKNKKGPFDILPLHENFVSEFSGDIEVTTESGERKNFATKAGVVEVSNNIARIFLKN